MTDTLRLSQESVYHLLADAANAPSGDNAQPWRFMFDGEALEIFNLDEADETQYNFEQRGSYLSHGALIENITLVAAEQGITVATTYFPDTTRAVARLTFTRGTPQPSSLVAAIKKRATNRKPYERRELTAPAKEALTTAANSADARLLLIEGDQVATLATTVSLNEQLLMENRALHDFLFGMIRWTKAEEAARPGLYIKTMEFPLPVQFLFRYVFKHWRVVQALNHIGLSRLIPTQSAAGYRASAAFGAIIIADETSETYVRAGRVFERVWLSATTQGLSIQPVTALPYLLARIEHHAAQAFSAEHQALILEANKTLNTICGLKEGERIAMLFRLGYGPTPTAVSAKRRPTLEP